MSKYPGVVKNGRLRTFSRDSTVNKRHQEKKNKAGDSRAYLRCLKKTEKFSFSINYEIMVFR